MNAKVVGRLLGGIAAVCIAVGGNAALAETAAPEKGTSARIDQVQDRGTLRVAVLGEFPWLVENTTGGGEPFSGPAWFLAGEFAKRLGVTLETVAVSHETKVPILASGQADITIAPLAITDARREVVDFVEYSRSSICLFGQASNPKLADVKSVDDLDNPEITMAYFVGQPPGEWAPVRLPKMQVRGVSGSGAVAPVEEILSGRADVAPLDNTKWPEIESAVSGLVVFPEDCLRSTEMATAIGVAIDKGQPEFLAWLTAVAEEIRPAVEANEESTIRGE